MPNEKKAKEVTNEERKLAKSAFYSDNLLAFLYKKAERLSVALYMMTSFLPEDEPVRKDLREKSLILLKNVSGLDGSLGEISVAGTKTLKTFFEINSTLDIATNSGMISEMNYSIVRGVITELTDIINNNFDIKNTRSSLLNPDFFSVKDIFLNEANKGQEVIKDIYKGQYYKRQNVLYNNENKQISEFSRSEPVKETPKANLSPKANDRRGIILNFLQTKPKINVSDLSEVIKDCSEKTLQRDLLKMVKEGLLIKEGERRWSTYRLA